MPFMFMAIKKILPHRPGLRIAMGRCPAHHQPENQPNGIETD